MRCFPNRNKTIENYEKSLELEPQHTNAVDALKKLRGSNDRRSEYMSK